MNNVPPPIPPAGNPPPDSTQDLRRRAEALFTEKAALPASSTTPPPQTPEAIRTLVHELQVHQIELEMQNEELRQTQQTLDAERARYFDLYDLAPVGYCTLSEKGLILEANLTFATLLGVPRNSLPRQPFSRFILKEDTNTFYQLRHQTLSQPAVPGDSNPTLAPLSCDLRIVRNDGSHFWAQLATTAVSLPPASSAPATTAPRVMRLLLSDISERKRADETQERLANILDATPDFAGFANARTGYIDYINPAGRRMIGVGAQEDVTRIKITDIHPAWANRLFRDTIIPLAVRNGSWTGESAFLHHEGHEVPILMVLLAHKAPNGEVVRFSTVSRDITATQQAAAAQARLQEQLFQAQKMESVGRLAGGIAHDFNNLLMSTLSYTDLCRNEIQPDHPIRTYLDEITAISLRSAALTRQLLAFARKEMIAPKVLDLNDTLTETIRMLRGLLGENIRLFWLPAPNLPPVKLDPSQIGQILTNLCINARDAISGVGTITIQTATATLDQDYCASHANTVPGQYVLLKVSDTGCGMTPDILARIFEPFYTTKETGKGVGLGLATVYGILTQNKGAIDVTSRPGEGSTFRIYLPRFEGNTAKTAVAAQTGLPRGHGETILMVDDEPAIGTALSLSLKALGYRIHLAQSPTAAFDLFAKHSKDIHLLLTDVIMPGMNGRDMATQLQAQKPDLKVLYMSGYTADVLTQDGITGDKVHFIQKPVTRADLAHKLRELLDPTEPSNGI